jgi:hypothetical protein
MTGQPSVKSTWRTTFGAIDAPSRRRGAGSGDRGRALTGQAGRSPQMRVSRPDSPVFPEARAGRLTLNTLGSRDDENVSDTPLGPRTSRRRRDRPAYRCPLALHGGKWRCGYAQALARSRALRVVTSSVRTLISCSNPCCRSADIRDAGSSDIWPRLRSNMLPLPSPGRRPVSRRVGW